jgi:cysteinyl-tRNA synthetase
MIEIIEALVERGHAYVVDGDVYYRVMSFPAYGELSGRSIDQMQAGARVEVDERKEHPMDFALWKAAKAGEPSWPSPWGPGRPGWHIECSAMSMQYLGEQLDIHGGGDDLRFPHHENEIAQSEGATGKSPFARYWIHNALMKPPVGEEMHRHLGNFVSIQDALGRYEPDAIRLFILSAHYRTPVRWTDEAVDAAAKGIERLRTALANADAALERVPGLPAEGTFTSRAQDARQAFERAMDNDFGTPQAVAALFDLSVEINRAAGAALGGDASAGAGLAEATGMLRRLAAVLGLRIQEVHVPPGISEALLGLLRDLRTKEPALFADGSGTTGPEDVVAALVAGRDRARRAKRFDVADVVRRQLGDLGIIVEDLPGGSRWRVAGRKDSKP